MVNETCVEADGQKRNELKVAHSSVTPSRSAPERLCSEILRRALLGRLCNDREQLHESTLHCTWDASQRTLTNISAWREGARLPCCSVDEAAGVCLGCHLGSSSVPPRRPETQRDNRSTLSAQLPKSYRIVTEPARLFPKEHTGMPRRTCPEAP